MAASETSADSLVQSEPEQLSEQDLAVYHRHDLCKKYLESYWYDKDNSAANRSGEVRHSIQKKKCRPRICMYPRVQEQIQQLKAEGNLRQVAVLLTELDAYLAAYPGSIQKPHFMQCNIESDDEDAIQFVDMPAAEIMDVENYVLQCMIVKVVKAEPGTPMLPVKQE